MTLTDYRSRIKSFGCLRCEPVVPTTKSSGGQRQCPKCRRKWSFGRLGRELTLLDEFARGRATREAADLTDVSEPAVVRAYAAFRRAVCEGELDRVRACLRGTPIGRKTMSVLMAVLDKQPGYWEGGATSRLLVVRVAGAMVFMTVAEADQFIPRVPTEFCDRRWFGLNEPAIGECDQPLRDVIRSRKRRVPPAHRPGHLVEEAVRLRCPGDIPIMVYEYLIRPRVGRRGGKGP